MTSVAETSSYHTYELTSAVFFRAEGPFVYLALANGQGSRFNTENRQFAIRDGRCNWPGLWISREYVVQKPCPAPLCPAPATVIGS